MSCSPVIRSWRACPGSFEVIDELYRAELLPDARAVVVAVGRSLETGASISCGLGAPRRRRSDCRQYAWARRPYARPPGLQEHCS